MRYATVNTWAKYFERHEGVKISGATIRNKLKKAEKIGETGRDRIGRLFKNVFYSESDIRSTCADLLNPESFHHADEFGFFEKNKERYGSCKAWHRELLISEKTIRDRFQKSNHPPTTGKSSLGRKTDFYSENDVRSVCADLLQPVSKADESGLFEKDGIRYGTTNAWSRVLPISEPTIKKCLQKYNSPAIPGKNGSGQKADFYSEYDVRSVCADLLNPDTPQADNSGFFKKDGAHYGTIVAWAREMPISTKAIKGRLQRDKIASASGKVSSGNKAGFYSESDIRSACADLLNPDSPQTDNSGFFEKDGRRYGTTESWSRTLPISASFMRTYIQKFSPPYIHGKDTGGHISKFYSESDIRTACADILRPVSQADKSGFFKKDGASYGTIGAWAKELQISTTTIKGRLQRDRIASASGKVSSGNKADFYSEYDVRSVCADLLNPDTPQADNSGFFEKDGRRYGTIYAWSRILPISESFIRTCIQKFNPPSIHGKDKGGRKFNFYSESDVRSVCADLISKRKPHAA